MKEAAKMSVSVFGLGYVGCVSIGCIAQSGHHVIGVDVKEAKVQQIQDGIATIFEPGLDDLIRDAHTQGKISATTDVKYAVTNSTISLVTVGTPSMPNGELNFSYIYSVAKDIGLALKEIDRFHTIAIRSTVKPGTCNEVMAIISQYSGKEAHKDFSVVANPEFLREGSAIKDYKKPPYVLIGADDAKGAEELSAIYSDVEGEVITVGLRTGEIIKYVNNSWHALKVVFGNEVGSICKALDINSQEVMDIFVRDRSLNISPNYLRPGFAYGGSCLPKDLLGFATLAKNNSVSVPVLENIQSSNEQHIQRAIELIKEHGSKKVSFLGLTFKGGTDDVRNSPTLKIIEALNADGYDIRVLDNDVNDSLQNQRNVETMNSILGSLVEQLVNTPAELLEHSKIIVAAKNDSISKQILNDSSGIKVIDLVFMGDKSNLDDNYVGLAW